jgi:hypothetical protein
VLHGGEVLENEEEEVVNKSGCKGYQLLQGVSILEPSKVSGRNIRYSSSPTQLRKVPFNGILGVGFSSLKFTLITYSEVFVIQPDHRA